MYAELKRQKDEADKKAEAIRLASRLDRERFAETKRRQKEQEREQARIEEEKRQRLALLQSEKQHMATYYEQEVLSLLFLSNY